MIKGYANGRPPDERGYIGAIADLLMRYPRQIAMKACDRFEGVPRECKFVPTPADVIGWCERKTAEMRAVVEIEDRQRALLAQRAAAIEEEKNWQRARVVRPTLQQMQEKHGPNWGLQAMAETDAVIKAKHDALIDRANATMFARECEAAGIDPADGVSPSLLASLLPRD